MYNAASPPWSKGLEQEPQRVGEFRIAIMGTVWASALFGMLPQRVGVKGATGLSNLAGITYANGSPRATSNCLSNPTIENAVSLCPQSPLILVMRSRPKLNQNRMAGSS